MAFTTFIIVFFVSIIAGLAAFLTQPAILLALLALPPLIQSLPYGLLMAQLQADADGDDEFDAEKPMGFTADVK